MVLTQSERHKKCREKKKKSGKYQDYLRKDRERKALKKSCLSKSDLDLFKFKNRESQRKSRARKKDNALKVRIEADHPASSPSKQTPIKRSPIKSPFSNTQSLGKARRKVERALPISPRKKVAIIALFSEQYSEMLRTYEKPQKHSGQKLPQEVKYAVLNLFEDNEVAWKTPGMKDFVITFDENKKKVRKQVPFNDIARSL